VLLGCMPGGVLLLALFWLRRSWSDAGSLTTNPANGAPGERPFTGMSSKTILWLAVAALLFSFIYFYLARAPGSIRPRQSPARIKDRARYFCAHPPSDRHSFRLG
jgi:hypothetical protein